LNYRTGYYGMQKYLFFLALQTRKKKIWLKEVSLAGLQTARLHDCKTKF